MAPAKPILERMRQGPFDIDSHAWGMRGLLLHRPSSYRRLCATRWEDELSGHQILGKKLPPSNWL